MPTPGATALRAYSTRIFQACSAPAEEAATVSDHLVTANLMGFDSHGVIRIPEYLGYVRDGMVQPGAPTSIVKETDTTATVDCGWNFGQVGALRAMEIAIEKARGRHVSTVATIRCCHAGRIGTYTQMAAEQGFVAIALANSLHAGRWVLPWGGREGRLATNPISFDEATDGGRDSAGRQDLESHRGGRPRGRSGGTWGRGTATIVKKEENTKPWKTPTS